MRPHWISLQWFFYIPDYNILYCEIPKAGSTTWMLGTFGRLATKLGLEWKNRIKLNHFLKVGNWTMLDNILKGDAVTFTNVRHPFERLVSAYVDKEKIWRSLNGKSFEEFLTQIVLAEAEASSDIRYNRMNHHWRPSNSMCDFCNIKLKYYSKMETFDEDRSRILEILELKNKKVEKMNVKGGNKTIDLTQKYFTNISTVLKTKLLDLYKYDFALFNYDKYKY